MDKILHGNSLTLSLTVSFLVKLTSSFVTIHYNATSITMQELVIKSKTITTMDLQFSMQASFNILNSNFPFSFDAYRRQYIIVQVITTYIHTL